MKMKHEYDIAEEMSKQLRAGSMEETTHVNKLAYALDCLNKAAELLDNMDDHKSSEIVTKVIERLASRK